MEPLSSVDLSKRPIPVPRSNRDSKKPVPLPRLTVLKEIGLHGLDLLDKDGSNNLEPIQGGITQNSDSIKTSLGSVSKMFKDELQERGKAVIESTRNVSSIFDKSMRGIGHSLIDKRRTGLHGSASKDEESKFSNLQRSHSLPSQDIGLGLFESITFQSPLHGNNEHRTKPHDSCLLESEGSSVDGSPPSAPPPMYPPPPLPDESVYDEVQSVISNNSSSTGTSNYDQNYCSSMCGSLVDSESYYEDLSMTRIQNVSPCSSNSGSAQVVRSDSWSLYKPSNKDNFESMSGPNCGDTIVDSPIYLNHDTSTSLFNVYEQDPTSPILSCRPSVSQSSDSLSFVLDDLEAPTYGSVEEGLDNDSSFNLPGRLSSCSVQNDLYTNWELPYTPSVYRDKGVEKRDKSSQSVIFQFDPLYENKARVSVPNRQVKSSDPNDNVLSLDQAMAPYGKINNIVSLDESLLETSGSEEKDTIEAIYYPIVPPRNYESIIGTSSTSTRVLEDSRKSPIPIPKTSNVVTAERCRPKLVNNDIANKLTRETLKPNVECSATDQRENLVSEGDLGLVLVKGRTSGLHRVNSIFKTLKSVADVSLRSVNKSSENSTHAVDRPNLSSKLMMYSGELYKATTYDLRKDFTKRYSVLAEGRLSCYAEKNCSEVREVFTLDTILSIQLVMDQKVSSDGSTLHCLDLCTYGKGRKISRHTFGSASSTERKVWMQKIIDSLTTAFPPRISSDFDRAGWCFMKEGISGVWTAAWILLTKRTLFYCLNNGMLQEIDLRKARCIELQECGPNSPKVAEKGQIILVDFPGQSLYLQADLLRETVAWRNIIKAASIENGPNLSQQQLTRDDIPAIVDKCISFVYAHGSMSEGIYRRSGANSSIERLLKQFRQDAWSVQLSRQEYTEYDVASTLKRFFRDLPESLLTTELHGELCEISEGKYGSDKLLVYRKTLEKLPPINFLTARKLLGHLYFIHEQHEKNLMPVENLSSIWGPTLLHSENSDSLNWSKVESSVVADLILLYPSLFDVDMAELTREKRIQETLERIHAGNSNIFPNKPSGDLKVWIHIGSRDSKNCVHVTIGPQKLAEEVCSELSSRMKLLPHELCLEETVFSGALVRPLHHTERVLDTVLRWGYWDETARKNNCLVLRRNTIVNEIAPLAKPPFTHSGELRFADQKTRTFKSHIFEFSQAKLCYYKDKSGSNKLGEWKIEDIVWYIGHEPKRNPQMRWSITFIEKHNFKKRSKENPFFGYTIAGASKDEYLKWMAAMLVGEYPLGLLPSPTFLQ